MKIIRIALLALMSSYVFAGTPNEFESITVGLKVTKPAEWQFISADENLESLKKIQLNDQEFQQLMQKYATAPLVAMMKYPEPYDDLNPSFKVNIRPLGQLKNVNPKQILNLFMPQFQKAFKNFTLVQDPIDEKISGIDAAYMRVNYSIAIPDGREFPTTSELWIVPRGDYFFMVGAGTRQDEKTGSRNEIKEILKTLEIRN